MHLVQNASGDRFEGYKHTINTCKCGRFRNVNRNLTCSLSCTDFIQSEFIKFINEMNYHFDRFTLAQQKVILGYDPT